MITNHRVWVYGDHVNTDVIFPGKYTYNIREPQAIAGKALEDLDPTFAGNVRAGDVIVAGRNWGCGSSREQAVTTLKLNGVTLIIAAGFGGLYYRNCINQGVLPVIDATLYTQLQTGDSIQVDHEARYIVAGYRIIPLPALSPSVQAIIDAGGLLPMLRKEYS